MVDIVFLIERKNTLSETETNNQMFLNVNDVRSRPISNFSICTLIKSFSFTTKLLYEFYFDAYRLIVNILSIITLLNYYFFI